MLRRLLTICFLWLSLAGLASAAVCATHMPPPEQEQPACPDHAPAAPDQLECCAFDDFTGPLGATSLEAPQRLEVEEAGAALTLAFADVEEALARFAARGAPPPPLQPQENQSALWLSTARLRL